VRRIALYGGTFDPFHLGHLAVARAVRDSGCVDEVRIVPVGTPPHRQSTIASADERWCMAVLATLDEPGLKVERWETELARQGPTYAVDTLFSAREALGGGAVLSWVIGMDALATLGSWHRIDEILQLANFLVLPRHGGDESTMRQLLNSTMPTHPVERFSFVPMPPVEISSSAVRRVLEQGGDPRPMLPPMVATFLLRYDPYRALRTLVS
jgi:nicotinate-nucleotide adenylyltransferase